METLFPEVQMTKIRFSATKDLEKYCEDMDKNIFRWYEWKDTTAEVQVQLSRGLKELGRRNALKPRKYIVTNIPIISSGHSQVTVTVDTPVEAMEYAMRASKLSWVKITEIHGFNTVKGAPVLAFYRAFRLGNEVRKITQTTLTKYVVDLRKVC